MRHRSRVTARVVHAFGARHATLNALQCARGVTRADLVPGVVDSDIKIITPDNVFTAEHLVVFVKRMLLVTTCYTALDVGRRAFSTRGNAVSCIYTSNFLE